MAVQSESKLDLDVVKTITDVDAEEWNDIVERSEQGGVFHRYEWLEAVESGLEYPVRHALIRKDTNLVGLCPNVVVELERTPFMRLVSLYPGFGGPLVTTDETESLCLLSDRLVESCSERTLVHEIRASDTSYLGYNNLLKTKGYRPTRDGCRFLLSLEAGYDELWDGMSKGRRRRIRRGRENDYELVEEEITRANIRRFHDAYVRVMERVGGDAFPLPFLDRLRQMDSRVLLISLYIDGEYAGGVLELLSDEQSTIHGLISAVPKEYFEYNASELLYDGVIQWGIDNGYETYDLGYTASDASDGLFRFKKSFGGEMAPNLSWERGCSPLWPLVRTGRSLYWSRYKST